MISLHFTKGDIMKKRDLTLERKIGICVLGLLVFLAINCSQDVLAVLTDISTNPVSLNVNAATQVAPALTKGMVNKFTYKTSAEALQNVLTNWTEKAVFGSVVAATGTDDPVEAALKVTVTVKAPTTTTTIGDLIIKVDMITVTTNSALSGNTTGTAIYTTGSGLIVQSYWLKTYTTSGLKFIGLAANLETPTGSSTQVTNTTLSSLCLYTDMVLTTAGTTINLLDFPVKSYMRSHVVFTAVLVDDASLPNPQVMGVDVKTIYFNYVDPDTLYVNYKPIWLDLVKAANSLNWVPMP
jgi:hypothetical protein